jgi:hypothetical protein
MKLLSFDVGIKNLSYCLLDDKENTIEDWGIINISVDPVCEHCMKGDKQCDKTAKFIIDEVKLCSSHIKLKKYKDQKSKKVKKVKNPILEIGKNIVEKLDAKNNFLDVHVVLIENQPALKNPTMKTIQMILYSYFLINGVTNNLSPIETIEMINARNKLKAYKGPIIECEIKDKYKRTKYLGIKYCEWMILENENIKQEYRDLLEQSKKKDDLADAYLQGMFWLTK